MSSAIEISIVVPVYRSAMTLRALVAALDRALANERVEYVMVVDGSPDESLALLQSLRAARAGSQTLAPLRIVASVENRGQHAALLAGFNHARGRACIVFDADLQYAPEELPRFIQAWRQGADLVAGFRRKRNESRLMRTWPSYLFNAFAGRWTGVTLRDFGCGCCLIDAHLIAQLAHAGARQRFLKPLLGSLAQRAQELELQPQPQTSPSSYSLTRLMRLAFVFVIGWSARPFWMGLIISLLLLAGALALMTSGSSWFARMLVVVSALGVAINLGLVWQHRRYQRDAERLAMTPPSDGWIES